MQIEKVLQQGIQGQLQVLRQSSEQLTQTQQPGQVRQVQFQQWVDGQVQSQQRLATDALSGTVRHTGQPFDIALPAGSLMVVEHQGQLRVSRDGHLQPDAQGLMRQASGALVLTPEGSPLTQKDFQKNPLPLWLVEPLQQGVPLPAVGAGVYQADLAQWRNLDTAVVQRQALNQAEPQLSQTMIELLQVQRSIESIQKAYQTYDATLSLGISELGRR